MKIEIPKIAENVDSAEVVRILVAVGDHVETDQPILELEGDKASFEMPSPAEGEIEEIRIEEGDEVKVGEVVMTLRAADEHEEEKAEEDDEEKQEEGEEQEEEEHDEEEEKHDEEEGAQARRKAATRGREVARAEPAPPRKPRRDGNGKRPPRRKAVEEEPVIRASPAARRKARELGVDLAAVAEEVRGARITPDAIERRASTKSRAASDDGEDFARFGEVSEEKLTHRRRIVAARMAEAWRTIPHVTQHEEIDVTELEAARRRWLERNPGKAPKLTITPLVVKACALALRSHPRLNASLVAHGTKLAIKHYVNVAVAVDSESGLVAPVVHGADDAPLDAIARTIDELAANVRAGRISHEALAGGTFTVTNLGGFGGTYFTPIIYPPQVAILGLCRTRARDGKHALPVSLSYDHRAVDGADAMRFLTTLAELLADPLAMLMRA